MFEKAGRCPVPGHSFDFFLLPSPSIPNFAHVSWLVISLDKQETSSSGVLDINHGRHQIVTSIVFKHRELTSLETSQIMWGEHFVGVGKEGKELPLQGVLLSVEY